MSIAELMECSFVTFVLGFLVNVEIGSETMWNQSIFLNTFHIHVLSVTRFWGQKMLSQITNIKSTKNVDWPWIVISDGISSYEDFDKFIAKGHFETGYYCTICQQFRKRAFAEVRNHVESKHFPNSFSYQCNLCDLTLGTNTALTRHKQRVHKIDWLVWWWIQFVSA